MTSAEIGSPQPFSLLLRLFGDAEMATVFNEATSLQLWMTVEVELARAQASRGIITHAAADDIAAAAQRLSETEWSNPWQAAANVGYPILGLVRALDAACTGEGTGRVHLGATTQDIMDTAIAIQIRDATTLLTSRLVRLGDALVSHVAAHRHTVMAGRTHAQQAVPITLGMKLAVVVDQIRRCIDRLTEESPRAAVVSLYGAAGTSAASGPHAASVRHTLAANLHLSDTAVPWHVARDGIFAQAANAAAAAEVSARFAREIVNLSRTEIAEVLEPSGPHRGASSTMPQKSNPILSEAVIGFAAAASSQLPALTRAMEAGHERSAGEWQIEWHVLPQVMTLASSAILRCTELAENLVIDTTAMTNNLAADHGLLMAEAYMIALSGPLGRERAHDVVTAACEATRRDGRSLRDTLLDKLDPSQQDAVTQIEPADYTGDADQICEHAITQWRNRT